jgi:hypothetical protein
VRQAIEKTLKGYLLLNGVVPGMDLGPASTWRLCWLDCGAQLQAPRAWIRLGRCRFWARRRGGDRARIFWPSALPLRGTFGRGQKTASDAVAPRFASLAHC